MTRTCANEFEGSTVSEVPHRLSLSPPDLPDCARRVCERLVGAGEQALLAGGAVRDHLLGRRPKDFDVASSATPERVAELFEKTVLVGAQFGVARVIEDDGEVEVVTFRTDLDYEDGRHPVGVRYSTPRDDAERRDFTINGLFYDLDEQCVIDYVGGLGDLARGCIRAIGDVRRRFAEDRLRMLRAVRFATTLGFAIDPATWDAVLDEAPAITEVSGERIRDELEKTLCHPRRELGYFLLSDSGLMEAILPEIEAMRGVEQPPQFHPEGDVHRHTGLVLSQLREPDLPLVLGALLHDVGKPVTFTVTDRIRFNKHESVGAEMAESICERLRLSRRQREEVVYLVQRHMVFMSVAQMRVAKRKRLFEEPYFEQLLRLGRADCLGSHSDTSVCDETEALYRAYLEEGPPTEPLLRGRDLIAIGVEPGPAMGRILESVEDARREGELTDRDAALAWVRDRLSTEPG